MTNPQDSPGQNPEDRLEKIKQEAKEDASSYYEQGHADEDKMTEEDFNKPVPSVDPEKEEMNLMKALAYLGFGMGALAIIVILFYLRNLDHKVGDVDAAVVTLENKFGPLKQELDDGLAKINADVAHLQGRMGSVEKQAAITELKRALVAIETVTQNTSPEVKAKSGQVVAHIQGLLKDLGAGMEGTSQAPAAVVPAPATAVPAPEEKPFEIILDQPASEGAPAGQEAPQAEVEAQAEPPAEAPAPAAEEPALAAEESAPEEEEAGGDDEGDSDDEDEDDEEDEEDE